MAARRLDPSELNRLSMAEQHEEFRRTPSRRRLLQGGLVGAGALLAGPSLLADTSFANTLFPNPGVDHVPAGPSTGAVTAPFGRHLQYGAHPSRQVTVSWQVNKPVANPFVRFGRFPGDLSQRVPAELRTVATPAIGSAAPVNQYYLHAHLDRLDDDATFFYAVGHDGFEGGRQSPHEINTFQTAPPWGSRLDPFTFTAFGDQGSSANAIANNSVILSQNPAFHLHAGDISYSDSSGSGLVSDTFDPRVWDQFFVQSETVAASVPWMAAVGNHDMEAVYANHGYAGDVARFTFPGNGPTVCPATYSFIYGNVAVVSLDANDVSNEIPANLGYSGGSQTSFLDDRLARLRRQPDVDFIVVFFHHCAYCTCPVHASEGGVRAAWAPLFDKYKVDLVVNGHNHVFERSDPIIGGQPTGPAPIGATIHPERQGTTYVTVGAAGRSLYFFGSPDSTENDVHDVDSVSTYQTVAGGAQQAETVSWSRTRFTGYSFLAVDSNPAFPGRSTSLRLRVLDETGTELDTVTLARTAGDVSMGSRGVDHAQPDLDL